MPKFESHLEKIKKGRYNDFKLHEELFTMESVYPRYPLVKMIAKSMFCHFEVFYKHLFPFFRRDLSNMIIIY